MDDPSDVSLDLPARPAKPTPFPEAPPVTPALAQALAVLRSLRPSPFTLGGGCRWIEGDARAPDGPRFCDVTRERGRPYCRAHCLRAYAGLQRISGATARLAVAAHSAPAAERDAADPGGLAWPEG